MRKVTERVEVYDLLANRRTVKIEAHQDDVNSCCWADTASGNVLISASDDTFLKVWCVPRIASPMTLFNDNGYRDRRSLGSSQKPSGVLIGHTEGITNVSAKGDGRYVISNGKDQALRLWDLRKMRTNAEYEAVVDEDYCIGGYDYRYMSYLSLEFPLRIL
jgi:WD repeat-containing protein 23